MIFLKIIQKLISLRRFRFLLSQLVKRDFKIKYRGSFFGVLWSVLNPLLNMVVLSVVFGRAFGAVENYKMYLLSGIIVFNFFSEATNIATTSVVSNFGLITKVYFPKFIIPTSKVLTSSINLLISTTVFFILGMFFGIRLWWGDLLVLYAMAFFMLFTMGMAYILSALFVFFRDTQHLYGVLLTVWMYATPIMYPIDILPENIQTLMVYNPIYSFINFIRQLTLYNTIPQVSSFAVCALWGIGLFLTGAVVFVKSQDKFIYYT